MNNDFWWQVEWFPEWKLLANHLMSDQEISCHNKPYIILFLTCSLSAKLTKMSFIVCPVIVVSSGLVRWDIVMSQTLTVTSFWLIVLWTFINRPCAFMRHHQAVCHSLIIGKVHGFLSGLHIRKLDFEMCTYFTNSYFCSFRWVYVTILAYLSQHGWVITCPVKCAKKLFINSQTSMVAPFEFGNA